MYTELAKGGRRRQNPEIPLAQQTCLNALRCPRMRDIAIGHNVMDIGLEAVRRNKDLLVLLRHMVDTHVHRIARFAGLTKSDQRCRWWVVLHEVLVHKEAKIDSVGKRTCQSTGFTW